MAPLTARRQRFIDEYLVDLNATQAAIRAGYSARTAAQQATRLLKNVQVAAVIADRQRALAEKTGITQERLVREMAAVGFASIRDVVSWGPDGVAVTASAELAPEAAAAVSEVIITEDVLATGEDQPPVLKRRIRLKMHPKLDALVSLARILGFEKPQTSPAGAGVQIIVAGGPMGLEVRAVAAAGSGTAPRGAVPPPGGASPAGAPAHAAVDLGASAPEHAVVQRSARRRKSR